MDSAVPDRVGPLVALYDLWLKALPGGASGRAGLLSRRYQELYRKVRPRKRQRVDLWRRIAALEAACGAA